MAKPDRTTVTKDRASATAIEGQTDAELLRLLVDNVRDYAIFLLDPQGNVASWNEGAARIKGYRAAEIIGRHFSTFYPEEDVRAGKPDWELVAATREGRFEDEGWRVRKDGTMFWANVVITALFDDTGTLRGFAKVTRDMTDRKEEEDRQLEQERDKAAQAREYAERMAQLEKVKGEFLNLASHELRGPLTVISGYLSLFEDGSIDATRLSSVLPVMIGKVRQIEGLVEQMLETARLEDGKLALALEKVDLRDVVRSAVDSKRLQLLPEHRLNVELPRHPVTVVGDVARLEIVVGNLLDNAIKYSPSGGSLGVTLTESSTRAFVSVQDEGIGIAPEDMPTLFTRFGRFAGDEHSNISGTGLGLYLSRELVRRHHGEILVESRLGRGSRFTVSLPKL
ncbi:MAG TPA: PAS domain-containing sensor histidine kinase [Candidatus Dormibacteraeota bacterium]